MSALTREELVHFSGNLHYRLRLLTQTRRHTDRLLSTRFNVFDYISREENRLSDIIANLVNPNGSHGQGDIFFKAFVATMHTAVPTAWTVQAVYRENTTSFIASNQRRLDVLIDLGTFGIAIENKPWADEQHDQIHDYVQHLERQYRGHFTLIYLSSDGAEPNSLDPALREQLSREKKLVTWAYGGRFHEWLTRCFHLCASEKFRWFLTDFLAFTEQSFPAQNQLVNSPDDE